MKIGVLEAGPVNPILAETYGQYGDVFRAWLAPHAPGLEFEGWAVHEGRFPDGPAAADAWIISGSRYGVYDGLDFIEPLMGFIRACKAAGRPMIGVCFGHQIMAEALGGHAEKFSGGWSIGPERYRVGEMPGWAPEPPETLSIHALHQDQVVAVPPDATVVAGSDFCRNAAMVFGDPEAPYAISIQPHPEFPDAWMRELIEVRKDAFPADLTAAAVERIGAPLTRDWAADWFLAFLKASAQG